MTFPTLLSAAVRRAALLILAAAMVSLPDAAAQTTYVVQSQRDQTVANASVPNGVVTLREALIAANTDTAFGDAPAGSGNDIITFDAGVTSVLISRGELDITAGVTIGNATSGTKVTLTVPANRPTRIFNVNTTDPVTLQGVSIEGGFSATIGGGILLGSEGGLNLTNVDILQSRAQDGGGLYVSDGASVLLTDVTFAGNRANGTAATNGGGAIYTAGTVSIADPFSDIAFFDNFATQGAGSGGAVLVASDGRFEVAQLAAAREGSDAGSDDSAGFSGINFGSNRAARAGGAIEVRGGGTVDITDTAFVSNQAAANPGNGGALHITGDGVVLMSRVTALDNFARNEGGAFWNSNAGAMLLSDASIRNNSTAGDGGGIYAQGTEGFGTGGQSVTALERSTVSENTADGFGGGLYAAGGELFVRNATLSGNAATRGGGGYTDGAFVFLQSATVAANTASGPGGGFLNADAMLRASLENTLVADNSAASGPQLSGFYTSEGNNLVETRAGAGIAGQQMSDLYETDAMIGTLDFNGGPTRTHALLAGSPAIDAGSTTLLVDQRGELRSEPDDIGAFDFGMPAAGGLLLTGVFDGPLSGGTPKAVEFYVTEDIADLGVFGFGSANNGGGTDGEEFAFPDGVAATAGEFLYVTANTTEFETYFGFAADYTDSAANINGDDAIELFQDGAVIDTFGDIGTDGTGEAWDYLDGWAYRSNGTGPDGTTFVLGNWTYSGINANDGETTNGTAETPFPIGTYSSNAGAPLTSTFGSEASATGLAPVSPNPIRSTGRVRFALDRSEAVTVSLYDVMGRRVQTLYAGTPAADVPVDVTVDARALASGVYVVVLEGTTMRQTQRVTVAR